jgi:pyrroline-5-carboxylate reductase
MIGVGNDSPGQGRVGRALIDRARSLQQLAAAHETPDGINEHIRTTWFTPANAEALEQALDGLPTDLK